MRGRTEGWPWVWKVTTCNLEADGYKDTFPNSIRPSGLLECFLMGPGLRKRWKRVG